MRYVYINGNTIYKCNGEEARIELAKQLGISLELFRVLKEKELPVSRYFFTENTICKYNSIPHSSIHNVEIIDIQKIKKNNKDYIFGLIEAQSEFRTHCENLNNLVRRGLDASSEFNIEDVETIKFVIKHDDGNIHTFFYRFVYDNYDKLEYYCDF
jgi:hypothetical protein